MTRTSVRVIASIAIFACLVMPARAQQPAASDLNAQIDGYERAAHRFFQGVPTDWSSRHLVFSPPAPGSQAEDQVQQDPRYWLQQIRRSRPQSGDSIASASEASAFPDARPKRNRRNKRINKDWSQPLGSGGKVGAGFYPAKFNFGTSAGSCSDYVAFNTSLAGAAGQASVISFTNLYVGGGCGSTNPTTEWAYNTGGTVSTSVTPSMDGAQVAFVQTVSGVANLVLLKWNAGPATHSPSVTTHSNTSLTAGSFTAADVGAHITGSNIPANTYITAQSGTTATISNAATSSATITATIHAETATAPGVPPSVSNANYRACVAPCMTSIAFAPTPSTAPNDTNSSPYYVISGPLADTIFVGDDTGFLHNFTGTFNGTPAEMTTGGWPAQAAVVKLSGPIYNQPSGTVFVTASYDGTSNGGRLHEVNASTGSSVATDQLGPTTASGANCAGTTAGSAALTLDTPIVDSSAGKVYAFIGNNGDSSAKSAVYQFAPGFAASSCGSNVTVGTGSSGVPVYSGAFDAFYYASTPTNPSGNLYVCGNAGGHAQLFRVPIASNAFGLPVGVTTTLSTANTTCSPVTEFQNGAVDRAFVSVQASGNTNQNCPAGGGGCIMSFNITSGLGTDAIATAAAGESGGTSGIIIDNLAGSGGSQVYFSTLGGSTAIQASQAAVN